MLRMTAIRLLRRTKKHLGDEYYTIAREKRIIDADLRQMLPNFTSPAEAAKSNVIKQLRLRKNLITRRLNAIHFEMEALDTAIGSLLEGA
jgi:hypothetical protein